MAHSSKMQSPHFGVFLTDGEDGDVPEIALAAIIPNDSWVLSRGHQSMSQTWAIGSFRLKLFALMVLNSIAVRTVLAVVSWTRVPPTWASQRRMTRPLGSCYRWMRLKAWKIVRPSRGQSWRSNFRAST